jgi:uncharacterized protein (TIGR03437 family)
MIVRGDRLSDDPPAFASGSPLPSILGGATVVVNGVAAPLYYSSSNQIAFQLPAAVATSQLNRVQVQRGSQLSDTFMLRAAQPQAPQIAVITDAAYNLVDAYHPARPGDTIILWTIGLGATNASVPDGAAAPSCPPAATSVAPVVQFGSSITVPAGFAGLSPGAIGLFQVNVTIPPATPKGNLSVKLISPYAISNVVPIAIR